MTESSPNVVLADGKDDDIPKMKAFTESVQEEITDDNDALILHGSSETKKTTSAKTPTEDVDGQIKDFQGETAEESKVNVPREEH